MKANGTRSGNPHLSEDSGGQEIQALRRQAEDIASKKKDPFPENLETLSSEEIRQMLHELRVHQIELEMQNEELRRAQTQLDAARERYFDLYDLAPVGYFTVSEEGLILEANLTAATQLGSTRNALVKLPITRFILKEDQDIYYRYRKRLVKTGMPQECELRILKNDGTMHWAHLAATVVQDADGASVGRIVMGDITERKRAEDELRESEERFRKLFKGHSAIKLLIDSETGSIIDANEASAQFYGWTVEELKQMRIQQISLRSPEDVKADMEKIVSQGAAKLEIRNRMADGSIRDVEVFCNKIEIAGKTPLYAIIHDITDRKQIEQLLRESEAQFRTIFEIASVGIVKVDPIKGRILQCNETYCQITGYSLSELLEVNFPEITHPEDRQRDWENFSRAIKGEISAYYNEKRYIRKDGITIWVRVNAAFIRDSNGHVIRTVAICEDITERKQAEKGIKASLAEKEVLLKELHHRVKNNMQIIASLVSLQADSQVDEQLQGVLSDVRNRIRTMALVHEKLYQKDDLEKLDFAEYISSLLNYLWSAHGAANWNLRLNMSLAPLILQVDMAVNCGLILNELANNSIKHAFPSGSGGEVIVTLEHDPGTGAVCLKVRDDGVGLPADLDWRQSSSLGLRLVQMLAGQMHGSVQTGQGPGTEFKINFNVNGIPS